VLTRGYGRSSSDSVVLRPGVTADPAGCGDEAIVLLRHFERAGLRASIGVGANRYDTGRRMLSENPEPASSESSGASALEHAAAAQQSAGAPDVLVLDDGFQHLKLERDLDLVLIDVTNPFGGGRLLPLGRLREPLSSLSRAGAILLTRTEPGQSYDELESQLRSWNPSAPIFRSSTRAVSVVGQAENSEEPLSNLAGRNVLAFCGLGNPESFWRVLRREGVQVVRRMAFGDHHRYSVEDLRSIANAAEASKADLLLTTEKDMVNLAHAADEALRGSNGAEPALAEAFRGLHWLKIETTVERGEELLRLVEDQMAGKMPPRVSGSKARAQVRA
jgi:tetraacyldisaccharide-1-P 4'-kinase